MEGENEKPRPEEALNNSCSQPFDLKVKPSGVMSL